MTSIITISGAFRFFLPLIFMTELNMISKSVIHAFLARMSAPKTVLAAFSAAFVFYFTLTSSNESATSTAIAFIRDRRSLKRVMLFYLLVLSLPVSLTLLVGLTSLGNVVFSLLFGVSETVIIQARIATVILAFSLPALIVRSAIFSLIMINRKTVLITISTLMRVLSLTLSLTLLPTFLEGAAVGAVALVTCMWVESFFATYLARGYLLALPENLGEPPTLREIWTFSWPIMLNQASESGVFFIINIFLGRLSSPDLALAAFSVVHGLANLLMSPLRNLVQTAQTLVRKREEVAVVLRFTGLLALFFTLLVMVLFLTPTRDWILSGVMGLTPELSAYSQSAAMLAFILVPVWGYAALFRGLLAGANQTRLFFPSAAIRLLSIVGFGSVLLLGLEINGAVFGMLGWSGAFLVEIAILGLGLLSLSRTGNLRYRDDPREKPNSPKG